MPQFKVRVRKRIETFVFVEAADAEEAKALAWGRLPEHVEGWNCDGHNGTSYKVEELEG